MTPAERARADVEAWFAAKCGVALPSGAMADLVAVLTAVYERVWRAEAEWASWKRLAEMSDVPEAVAEARRRVEAWQRKYLALPPPADPLCAGCGGPHPYDTTLPSPLWNRVARAAGLPDYLCTTCIVAAFVRAGESFEAELYGEPVNRPGSVAPTIRGLGGERPLADTYGALQHEVRTLREQLATARAVWAARDGQDYDWWEAMGAALGAELPP